MPVKSTIVPILLSIFAILCSGCVDEEDKFLRENLRDSRWLYYFSIADKYDFLQHDQSKEMLVDGESSYYRYNNIEPPIYNNPPPPPLTFYESVKTLLGIDRDQDGIRDDFERYINFRYGHMPPIRDLLHKYNWLWQKMVEEYFVKQNTYFPERYEEFYRMRRCIIAHDIGGHDDDDLMFNTKKRYQAFLDINYSHWRKMEATLAKYDMTRGNKKSKLLCPEHFLLRYTITSPEEDEMLRTLKGRRK